MSGEAILSVEELTERTGLPVAVDTVVEPVSEDMPAGIDLRDDESGVYEYYRLRDLRTQGRNRERESISEGESDYLRPGDWQPLVDELPWVLSTKTKDAELVAWLIEALTRLHGFAGAALGFHLAARLIEAYGEQLHPRPDEEGVGTQLAALAGLNGLGTEGALITPLKSVALTEGHDVGPFSAWQCEQAFELARISDDSKRDARSKRGYVTQEELDQAVAQTSTEFLRDTSNGLQTAITQFNRYRAALDAYVPDNPQPTSRLENTLDACQRTVNYLSGERLSEPVEHSDDDVDDAAEESVDEAAATEQSGLRLQRITDRETALRQLQEIARFFRETEPHSPISYSIEQVVRWSELSLPELIQELIPDEGARSNYRTRTGIPSPEE